MKNQYVGISDTLHQMAKLKAKTEYDKFRVIQDKNYISDFDKEVIKRLKEKK